MLLPYRCGRCGELHLKIKAVCCPICNGKVQPLAVIHYIKPEENDDRPGPASTGPLAKVEQASFVNATKMACKNGGCPTCHRTSCLCYVTCEACLTAEGYTFSDHRYTAPSATEPLY
jgi:hypothetical protein